MRGREIATSFHSNGGGTLCSRHVAMAQEACPAKADGMPAQTTEEQGCEQPEGGLCVHCGRLVI